MLFCLSFLDWLLHVYLPVIVQNSNYFTGKNCLQKFDIASTLNMNDVIIRCSTFTYIWKPFFLKCHQVTPKTFIPALFGHANCDKFVQPHHSELIYNSYAVLSSFKIITLLKYKALKFLISDSFLFIMQGDKNIIKFDGDHNSSRPQFYYDSVSIFFYNVLHPPQLSSASHASKLEKYYDLGDLKIGPDMDEVSFHLDVLEQCYFIFETVTNFSRKTLRILLVTY